MTLYHTKDSDAVKGFTYPIAMAYGTLSGTTLNSQDVPSTPTAPKDAKGAAKLSKLELSILGLDTF